jgi:hypothetical protein
MVMIEVYLNDSKMEYEEADQYFMAAHEWAQKNCPSYQKFHVQDVADFSYMYDLIARYQFTDEKDAVFFQLKWKND